MIQPATLFILAILSLVGFGLVLVFVLPRFRYGLRQFLVDTGLLLEDPPKPKLPFSGEADTLDEGQLPPEDDGR